MRFLTLAVFLSLAAAQTGGDLRPALASEAVRNDPDDPAIWRNRRHPGRSVIVATNKVAAPDGAVVVYGLDGKLLQTIAGIDRPNNVDIEYGLILAGKRVDIAVATERLASALRVFIIDDGRLRDLGRVPVLAGQTGQQAMPMGIGLYRRPRDGAIFAIVAPKTGPQKDYLWQYRLEDNGQGGIRATLARRFGAFSGTDEIEAVAVDDELGYVYYADESAGIRKYHADPEHRDAPRELALFGTSGFTANREGIAIYRGKGGRGYLICTDQLPGSSAYHFFRREGLPGNPHDHSKRLAVIRGGADNTDGLEVMAESLGPAFPNGLMVAMNSSGRNFLFYRWADIAARLPR